MLNSASNSKGFIERELHWGLSEDSNQLPITSPSYKAFCEINEETFATSDGRHVSIWNLKSVLATFDLKALALHYIKLINHVVAYQNQTTELFFISMRSPYTLTKHPFLFSNKVITVIHYFESSSILVTCGQGMMLTKVIIPPMFKNSTPIPEMLKFEKIAEIYEDTLFSNIRSPIFLDSKEVVIVYFDNLIQIHLLDGTCIQKFSNISLEPISCVNYYEDKDWLIVGDQQGGVYTIQFQSKRPFDPNAHPETGSLITPYHPETCFLLYAQVFESDFMVTISLNRRITLFSLVTEKPIQTRLFSLNPMFVHYSNSKFLIFSMKEITTFFCNIFTKHFASLSADSLYLQRCPSLRNAARILCHTNDSIISLYSPKSTKLLFGIRALHYQYDINNVVYSRDLIRDGIMIKPLYSHQPKSLFKDTHEFENYIHGYLSFDFKGEHVDFDKSIREFQSTANLQLENTESDLIINTNLDSNKQSLLRLKDFLDLNFKEDYGYFMMGHNKLLMIDFHVDGIRRKGKEDLFASTTFMKENYLKNRKSEELPIPNPFVSFIRIESAKYQSCLLGVCKSGHCYIFSIDNLRKGIESTFIEEFSLGYGMVLCAVYSLVHKLVVLSCLEHTVLYDIDKHRIVLEVDRTYYRSMLVVSDRTLACGCANGALEIRSFPSMKIQASSRKFGAYHSDHGYRRDLTKELDSYERTLLIDFSITTIDYCSPRNSLLTMSPNGEIFVWSIEAFPICHLMLDFPPTAACFLNGFGTVIISSMKTLYTIDWSTFFLDKLESEKTILDDFDLLDDKFDLDKFAETRLDHTEELEFMVNKKQTPSHKFQRVREDDLSDESTEMVEPSSSPAQRRFSPFRIRRNTFHEKTNPFEDLVVDEDEFPKNHFWKQNINTEEKPKKRKINPFKLLKLPSSALVDMDNSFKNNEILEQVAFKRKCEVKKNKNNSVKKSAKTPIGIQRTRNATFSSPKVRISKMSKNSATNSATSFESLGEKSDSLPKINSVRKRSHTISVRRKPVFRLDENPIQKNENATNQNENVIKQNEEIKQNQLDNKENSFEVSNSIDLNESSKRDQEINLTNKLNENAMNEINKQNEIKEITDIDHKQKNENHANNLNNNHLTASQINDLNNIQLNENHTNDLNSNQIAENQMNDLNIDDNQNENQVNNVNIDDNQDENQINHLNNDESIENQNDADINNDQVIQVKKPIEKNTLYASNNQKESDEINRNDIDINNEEDSSEPILHSSIKTVPKRQKKLNSNQSDFYPDPAMIAQASCQTEDNESTDFTNQNKKEPETLVSEQVTKIEKPNNEVKTKPKEKVKLKSVYRSEPIKIEINMNEVQHEPVQQWKMLSSVYTNNRAMIREPKSDASNRSSRRQNKKDYKMNTKINEITRNPLLYVQNYNAEFENNEPGNQEEEFKSSEPYVIEDLRDPRMKFIQIGTKKV